MDLSAGSPNISRATNTTEFPPILPRSEAIPIAQVFMLVLQTVIAFCGVTWNILICVVIARKPAMRVNSFYFYICNLAISDLGVLLVNFPLMTVRLQLSNSWPFGEFFCLYVFPATDVFFGASIWTISVIAIQRYRNIATQIRFRAKGTTRRSIRRQEIRTAWIIVGIWVSSFIVMSLPVYFYMFYLEFKSSKVCYTQLPNVYASQIYTVVLTLFCYVLPLCIISLTYVAISRQLEQAALFHKQMEQQNRNEKGARANSRGLRNSKKSKKILTPLVIIFAISMLPLNLLKMVLAFWPNVSSWDSYSVLLSICTLSTIMNSASDPLVYTVVSKDFREGFKRLCINCPLTRQAQGSPSHPPNRAATNNNAMCLTTKGSSPPRVRTPVGEGENTIRSVTCREK